MNQTPKSENEFLIRFEELSSAEAGVQAQILKEYLLDAAPDVSARVERTERDNMDLGATLILVLGTPAILAIAKGIAAFVARERKGKLIIEHDGTVVFEGNSSDAAKVAEASAKLAEALRSRTSVG